MLLHFAKLKFIGLESMQKLDKIYIEMLSMTVIARVLIKETLGCIVCVRMVRMVSSVMLQPTSSVKV